MPCRLKLKREKDGVTFPLPEFHGVRLSLSPVESKALPEFVDVPANPELRDMLEYLQAEYTARIEHGLRTALVGLGYDPDNPPVKRMRREINLYRPVDSPDPLETYYLDDIPLVTARWDQSVQGYYVEYRVPRPEVEDWT